MEIVARHYETLRASYDGSRSLRRVRRYTITTFTDETKKTQERQPREANLFILAPHDIKFGPSFKRKHSQVRVKYW
jgi:hypothetical protein